MDEVRLYNRALTSAEVSALYNYTGGPDTTPPSTPANVSAIAVSGSQINVSWAASTDNVGVAGYQVFRNSVLIKTTTALSYNDTGLAASSTYSYTVAAFDAAGNYSPQSAPVSATTLTPDTTPPSTPASVSAIAVSSSQINVSWAASTDNVGVAGYQVFRNSVLIKTTTALSYNDTGLAASSTYSYTVAAFDAAGNYSPQSAPVSATTLTPDTTPPTVSITTPVGGSTVSSTVTASASASRQCSSRRCPVSVWTE